MDLFGLQIIENRAHILHYYCSEDVSCYINCKVILLTKSECHSRHTQVKIQNNKVFFSYKCVNFFLNVWTVCRFSGDLIFLLRTNLA